MIYQTIEHVDLRLSFDMILDSVNSVEVEDAHLAEDFEFSIIII